MRIGIDLDGVCYDFSGSLAHYLNTAGQLTPDQCTPPQRWEFYEDWGLDLRAFLAACHAGVDAGIVFTHGDPFPGTREALDKIKDAGHTIHIVTDRSFGKDGGSVTATARWLARHSLPYDSLTFTADKTAVRLDAMVDDKPANVAALTGAGVKTWMFDRAWNRGHCPTAPRVTTLNEYAEALT